MHNGLVPRRWFYWVQTSVLKTCCGSTPPCRQCLRFPFFLELGLQSLLVTMYQVQLNFISFEGSLPVLLLWYKQLQDNNIETNFSTLPSTSKSVGIAVNTRQGNNWSSHQEIRAPPVAHLTLAFLSVHFRAATVYFNCLCPDYGDNTSDQELLMNGHRCRLLAFFVFVVVVIFTQVLVETALTLLSPSCFLSELPLTLHLSSVLFTFGVSLSVEA